MKITSILSNVIIDGEQYNFSASLLNDSTLVFRSSPESRTGIDDRYIDTEIPIYGISGAKERIDNYLGKLPYNHREKVLDAIRSTIKTVAPDFVGISTDGYKSLIKPIRGVLIDIDDGVDYVYYTPYHIISKDVSQAKDRLILEVWSDFRG